MSVSVRDIHDLLGHFAKNLYRAKESEPACAEVMHKCIELMRSDYSFFLINNSLGELSAHYPSQLIIPECELHAAASLFAGPRTTSTIYESLNDVHKLRDLMSRARFARCRARFPLPVILYRGKYICRSATLSGGPEIYGRSGLDFLFCNADDGDCGNTSSGDAVAPAVESSDWQLFDRVRRQDIKLLKALNVGTIIDFMVEKKKVKFGMNVTSSEKVDKEKRYADFSIVSLPYPGCEFFREYRDNDYTAEGLVFDWSQAHVDASVGVPDDPVAAQLRIDWNKYKAWDLVRMTQNYVRLVLRYLHESSSGLLIHCISGWDRTPLFVSMVRLSLWADGLVHQSLDALQILYLTIAYDWMLFGHNLEDRLSKGEEIFFFCFYMLKYLTGEEFSVQCQAAGRPRAKAGGISVARADSDSHLDGMLLEQESRGSNVSLNSSCSSVSSKSQDAPPVWFHVHSEDKMAKTSAKAAATASSSSSASSLSHCDSARRTSPMAVPVASSSSSTSPSGSRFRQRQESSSSISAGSWQMISGTGSLRGSDTNAPPSELNGQTLQDSGCTLVDEDSALSDALGLRRERLHSVRTAFYSCYCSTIGFKFKNGPDSALSSLLGNFAEKVGFSQRTT